MKKAICSVCGESGLFRPGFGTCNTCNLTPSEEGLVNRVIARLELDHRIRTLTKAGKRDQRRADRLAAYAAAGGKRCSACWHRLPVSLYTACATHGDGLQQVCKICLDTQATLRKQTVGITAWYAYRDSRRRAAGAIPPDRRDKRQKGALLPDKQN